MKNKHILKKLLSCALLLFGGIISLQAATLTVKVKDSYGQPLPGVAVQWVVSQFTSLGTTDANGEVTGTITNNVNYKVKLTYNNTAYQTPTAKSSGTGANTDNFNTSELKFTTKSGGLPVAGIGVQYMSSYPSGSWIQAGSTDVNGEKSVQVFAFDNMIVRASANASLKTDTILSFPYGTTQHVECFSTLIKLQSPGASFLIAGSYVPGGTGKYVFPGNYQVKINNTYSSNVTIVNPLFDLVPIVIVVKDHNNNPIAGAPLRGGYGTIPNGGSFSWHAAPTDNDGITVDWTNPGSNIRSYEAKVNGTTAAQTKDINLTGGNVFLFKSNELTLKLKDCANNGVAGGSARYGIGSNYSTWYVPGANSTNASGITTMEAFPGTYSFEMNINQSSEVKQIVFTGSNSLTWTTTKVAINWPYGLAYGGGGGNAWFPDKTGTEMLPGIWNFRFDGPAGQTFAPITVSGCSTSKFPIIVRFIESNGNPIANGQSYYNMAGWQTIPATNANGNAVVMMDANPGMMYIKMFYLGADQAKMQDVTTNPIITFQTTLVTVDFKNSDNSAPMDGYDLYFRSDVWRTFGAGATNNGTATMELLPSDYLFQLSYEGVAETKEQDVTSNNTVSFNTVEVTVKVLGNPISNQDVYYRSSAVWGMFGTTGIDGIVRKQLLPTWYEFTPAFNTSLRAFQDVTVDPVVYFETGALARMSHNTPISSTVSFYPNPAVSSLNISMPASGTAEILSIDGRKLAKREVAEGMNTIDLSSIPAGNHIMIVNYNGKTETLKFSKN